MQKPYNVNTNTLKAYLSAQASSLNAFVISKTHNVAQKLRGRQLNAKVCGRKSVIFRSSLFRPRTCQTTITRKRLRHSHLDFSTKLMFVTARSFPTTQRLHSFKFPLVKNCSQHCLTAVRCVGCHFLILYACVHAVSFLDQKPQSLL